MARISGNINQAGNKISNTSQRNKDFTPRWNGGDYEIQFSQAYGELPSVVVQEINYDFRGNEGGALETRITPREDSVTVGFFSKATGAPVQVQFGFAAW